MEKLTIDDIPKGIIGETSGTASTPKKGKRKSGAHLKRYDPDEPIIIVLDSLGISHPKTIKVLKDYILEEGRAKRSMEATITQNALYVRDAHIPMQPNYTDCGVYLLAYVQKFFENPKRFVTRILTREMDRETDWPDMNASAIRHTMRNMLQSIAKKQREERKAQKKNKKGTSVATGNANAGAPVEASKPQLLPAIQLKKSAAATSPTDSAPATQERVPSRSPRKKSPKVVIPSVSHETRKSPKRSLDESNHDEAAEPRARNGLSQLDGPTSSPKRQKLDGEFRSDGPAEESTVGTRTSPRLAREPSTERMKMTPVPKSLPASRRELQVQSETLQVRNEDLGRSSAEPIEIEDSLDIIELGSDTKNRTRSLQQQRPPERTKASYSNKGQAGHGASIDLRSPKNAHSQSQYPRKVPIEVVDDTPREVTERQPSQRTAAARNSGLVGQGYQYIEDDDTTIQETPPPEEIAE
jgi:sentrin-specific protease 7